MASLTVRTIAGEDAGAIEVADALVGAEISLQAVRQCVDAYLANRRQGTAMTKTRGLVRGGGAKPWRQKGTGRARSGSNRSPIWRGGGTTFGPVPRSYRTKVNKKVRRLAFRSVLTDKRECHRLTVVDTLVVEDGRLKTLLSILEALQIAGKVLIVTAKKDPAVCRAAANRPGVDVQVVDSLSVYDLIHHDHLLVVKDAIPRMEEMWG